MKRRSAPREPSESFEDSIEQVVASRRASYGSGLPDGLDRALQMFSTYPTMRVAGTAFENALRKAHRTSVSPMPEQALSPRRPSALTSPMNPSNLSAGEIVMDAALLREAASESLDVSLVGGGSFSPASRRKTENMVKLAAVIKRAAMWQSIVTVVMAHRALDEQYRTAKLRAALERHMLPTLLKRREETGSVVVRTRAEREDSAKASAENELMPNVPLLREYSTLLASFNSSVLLEDLTHKMNCIRFAAGETIARTDEPAQNAMYILVSGKCEYRRVDDRAGSQLSSPTTAVSPVTAPDGQPMPRVIKEILTAGSVFGGIFRTAATYRGTYKAISRCVVWGLTASSFESVFVPFADDTMRATYVEALRQHGLEWIQQRYRFPDFIPRTPIYRLINPQVRIQRYEHDFTPVAMVRGDTLFEQGDPPGDVYVLLEGSVRRSVKGVDGTYITGVSQLITPNDFGSFKMQGRFLMLGEECHVLPSTQRYLCRVYSRSAMFLRIPGERFVSALLDDPTLYVTLREKLAKRIRGEMKLDPSCLSFVPLMAQFPEECLPKIAEQCKAGVVFRSESVCEPAQQIKEIYLVTEGSVRDARAYDHEPTPRLPTPPPKEEESSDDEAERMDRRKALGISKDKAAEKSRKKNFKKREEQLRQQREEEEEREKNFNFSTVLSDGTMALRDDMKPSSPAGQTRQQHVGGNSATSATTAVVYPDEQQEFNPSMPPQPAKRFLFCLGGGWEGLLLDKWPCGWDTTSTVELWRVPTVAIRTAFNDLPKSTQNSILLQARQLQKTELGLPKLVVEKLPPMSSYLPEKVVSQPAAIPVSAHGGRNSTGVSRASTGATRSRQGGVESSFLASDGVLPGSDEGHDIYSVNYSSGEQRRGQTSISLSQQPPLSQQQQQQRKRSAHPPDNGAGNAAAKSVNKKRQSQAGKGTPGDQAAAAERKRKCQAAAAATTAPTLPSASKTGKPISSSATGQRRTGPGAGGGAGGGASAGGATSSSEVSVTPQLLAVYTGEYKNDDPALNSIITGPDALPANKARKLGGVAHGPTTAESWPSVKTGQKNWFREVPTYEPLPGTINNRNQYVTPPDLVPNSLYMNPRGAAGYGETLNRHADYFSTISANNHSTSSPLIASTAGGELLLEDPTAGSARARGAPASANKTSSGSNNNNKTINSSTTHTTGGVTTTVSIPKRKALPM